METKQNFSSTFVNLAGIMIFFLLSLVANYLSYFALSAFLLFVGMLCTVSYLWGKWALSKVSIAIEAENFHVFPGNTMDVVFKIDNNKMLPLIWIELLMRVPNSNCIVPDETFIQETHKDFKTMELYEVFKRKFTWIMWHQKLQWHTKFNAIKRGIYFFDKATAVSGDGFGLSIKEKEYVFLSSPCFVVFPQLVAVDTTVFMRNMYCSGSGSRGFYEDITLLRSNRAYQNGDSFKKINWRMVARQDKLQVNLYETILPKTSFFVLDVGSFRKEEVQNNGTILYTAYEEALEEGLSILGSIIIDLDEKGMTCGLAIPQIGEKRGVITLATQGEVQAKELLSLLAGVDFKGEATILEEEEIAKGREFMGQVYIVCKDVKSCTCPNLLGWFDKNTINLLCYQQSEEDGRLEEKKIYLKALKECERVAV